MPLLSAAAWDELPIPLPLLFYEPCAVELRTLLACEDEGPPSVEGFYWLGYQLMFPG